jgi:hypothetical protein
MFGVPIRTRHGVIKVTDTDGKLRNVCRCQIDDEKHTDENGNVQFPVYECSWLTEKRGFGTEEGF